MHPTIQLPEGALTLRPATAADRSRALTVFQQWYDENDGRFVIRPTFSYEEEFLPVHPALKEEWDAFGTVEGPAIEIRRADCGAGCRCAGEFRFA